MTKPKRPQDIRIKQRFRVVEGLHDGKEGIVVEQEISSFGFVWIKLQKDDGEIFKTRWTDLEAVPSNEGTVA